MQDLRIHSRRSSVFSEIWKGDAPAIGWRTRHRAWGHILQSTIFQEGHDFVAVIEMPGMSRDDLELKAKGNTIRISGKKSIAYGDKVSIHRRERVAGNFDRTISVPVQIDPDAIKAELSDGILILHIPRAEGDKPRTIAIT